jgi:2-succinyl-6-hydroxy-2,4-cyclohexadiene-1-carboxylate synthase
MPFADLNGVRYHYEVVGEGPPLLLLHGFSGSLENWAQHVRVFAQHFQVITLDLLGHGKTDAPDDALRFAMDKAAADVVALLDCLDCAPLHLLSYSMGGRLALYIALHYPDRTRSLILESASPGLERDEERTQRRISDEALAQQIDATGIPAFVDYWESIPLVHSQQQLTQEVRQRLRQQRLKNSATGLANSLRGMGTGAQPDLWPQLAELKLPVMLIAGNLDEKFLQINQRMAGQMPQAQIQVIADAGHSTHLEAPERFQQAVLNFLQISSAS